MDSLLVSAWRMELLAARHVDQPHHLPHSDGQGFTARREGERVGSEGETMLFLAGGNLPQADGAVRIRRCQRLAIGGEGDIPDPVAG